jgi:DNA invertase Pin-like site-specific DNA recombinase
LALCLKALRDGDTLVVWKLDRLGRNLHHFVNTVHDLTARGVGLKVVAGQDAAIDTTTPAGKLVFGIFAALAELERELISERTSAGLVSARARGPHGWPAVQDDLGQATSRDRLNGPARHQDQRALRRARGHPPNALGHVSPTGELRPDGLKLVADTGRKPR